MLIDKNWCDDFSQKDQVFLSYKNLLFPKCFETKKFTEKRQKRKMFDMCLIHINFFKNF